jgi:hypothetical protein
MIASKNEPLQWADILYLESIGFLIQEAWKDVDSGSL